MRDREYRQRAKQQCKTAMDVLNRTEDPPNQVAYLIDAFEGLLDCVYSLEDELEHLQGLHDELHVTVEMQGYRIDALEREK